MKIPVLIFLTPLVLAVIMAASGCMLLPIAPRTPYPGTMPVQAMPQHEEEVLPPADEIPGLSADEKAVYEVYRLSNKAVVNITSVSVRYNWFLQPMPQEGTGFGSIIDADGTVLTNYHVIKETEHLFVTLSDGSNFEAEVVGADPENDLAVIRFDPGNSGGPLLNLRGEMISINTMILAATGGRRSAHRCGGITGRYTPERQLWFVVLRPAGMIPEGSPFDSP